MPKSTSRVRLSPSTHTELKKLQGNVRRQMINAIDILAQNSRPPHSKQLLLPNEGREVRRLRHERWRIIYVIIEEQPVILGVRRRPPYDYDDLATLLEDV